MDTRKRQLALQRSALAHLPRHGMAVGARPTLEARTAPPNPACVPGAGQFCRHPLVDAALNAALLAYEQTVRGRFEAIEDVLRSLSARQHDRDFVEQAQALARQRLDTEWPLSLLEHAWVAGVDMAALQAHALFATIERCVRLADQDRAPWMDRLPVQAADLRACGIHTLDVSPCADGRLQGLLPFVLRTAPSEAVAVKAYAGALFDVELDVAEWTQRELERLSGALPGAEGADYLKVAVYHFSSSHPQHEGCAAHGSHDARAVVAAIERLHALREAVNNTYGEGAAPLVMLLGVDTDLDALRVHLPDACGRLHADRFLDAATLYRETLGMSADAAHRHIETAVVAHVQDLGGVLTRQPGDEGLARLAQRWITANLSQIEYVIQHHAGRYAVIGHDEHFICVGDALPSLQLRNQYYHAHLDTVEEGAADLDVGVKIFTALNLRRGLALPMLVHFTYSSRVPGARQRAIERGHRVVAAIRARYAHWDERGRLHARVAVSDRYGRERVAFVDEAVAAPAGH
ncbi:carboxysome shell carbonic anhydrase [Tepidimonas taiwanensis]|uniref:Carboxysome shell carbonic anhydrase n=1 Tax=Tepidimonas taiwanensis TaxID=307486 RepID=A0A554X4D6_9BURK|nr:carboxysome shell carbonic anhydrase [Tepidimonas taiwanensis]MCX7693724.1 carboxysome shell carbonic anhydrase [Tepidimonas taiwanensis]TSE30711.1 carboxysome shell carbonic anhydrase [Tepidimonas taiwanensis]UBQ05993.1 carboxysome shell carbonic anhydrase [Tepidimonas taiwanensis]